MKLDATGTIYEYLVSPDEEAGWYRFLAYLQRVETDLRDYRLFPGSRELLTYTTEGGRVLELQSHLFDPYNIVRVDWEAFELVRTYSDTVSQRVGESREFAWRLKRSIDEALPHARYVYDVLHTWYTNLLTIRWHGCQPQHPEQGFVYAPEIGLLRRYNWGRIHWHDTTCVSCSLVNPLGEDEKLNATPEEVRKELGLNGKFAFLVVDAGYWPDHKQTQLDLIWMKVLLGLRQPHLHGLM